MIRTPLSRSTYIAQLLHDAEKPSPWPHRLGFALAAMLWILSLPFGVDWLALAAVSWLVSMFRWERWLAWRSERRIEEFKCRLALLERQAYGIARAMWLERQITPDWAT